VCSVLISSKSTSHIIFAITAEFYDRLNTANGTFKYFTSSDAIKCSISIIQQPKRSHFPILSLIYYYCALGVAKKFHPTFNPFIQRHFAFKINCSLQSWPGAKYFRPSFYGQVLPVFAMVMTFSLYPACDASFVVLFLVL
jgi:hypothetical protein